MDASGLAIVFYNNMERL